MNLHRSPHIASRAYLYPLLSGMFFGTMILLKLFGAEHTSIRTLLPSLSGGITILDQKNDFSAAVLASSSFFSFCRGPGDLPTTRYEYFSLSMDLEIEPLGSFSTN